MATLTKGQIYKEDLNLWDGSATTTGTRKTSTGGTQTLNKPDWVGVDVHAVFGARNDSAITSAVNSVGSTNKRILFLSPGTWTLSASLTLGSNIFLQIAPGATLSRDASETLTVYSPANLIVSPQQQITAVDMIDFTTGGTVYPEWWGALGDGSTDDTNAFSYATSALNGLGGDLILSKAVYIASNLETYGGINWRGPGWEECEVRETDGVYTLSINKGSGGTTDPDANEKGIEITGIHFSGAVVALGFSEHVHVLNFNAVSDLWVHHCKISGFRGDGIYVGSSNTAATERHNENVLIENNIFDGIANDNRNGVSIIDCDGCTIRNNLFENCTKATMPGAIDIEPDAQTFAIVKNITVEGNVIKSCGGNVASITFAINGATFTTQPEHFRIINNTFEGTSNGIAIVSAASSYARGLDIVIQGNAGTCVNPINVGTYIEGIKILDNHFNYTGAVYLGYNSTDYIKKATVRGNHFMGADTGTGIIVRNAIGLEIAGNILADLADRCILLGDTGAVLTSLDIHDNIAISGANGIVFNGGTFTRLKIHNNDLSDVSGSGVSGTVPAGTKFAENFGYVTKAAGAASVAHGGTIAHGLAVTPTVVKLTVTTAGNIISVDSLDATNITVNIYLHDGSTVAAAGTVYWEAEYIP